MATTLNKSELIAKLENTFNANFGDEIDEYVLRGIWKRNGFESLYICDVFNGFNSVDKARFEGIIDSYFNKNDIKSSKKESSPLIPYNTEQIAEPDPSSFHDIELQTKDDNNTNTIPTPSNNYPICGNACMDCCEDVCEHAICCNCASSIYDVWDESIAAGNNNVKNVTASSNNNDDLKDGSDVVNGFFYNACEDCCEDICEHAICCNCTANIVSHWFEAVDVDNGNELEPVFNGDENDLENNRNLFKLQEKAFKHIHKARKICCAITCMIFVLLVAIAMILFYFLYYKPNYK